MPNLNLDSVRNARGRMSRYGDDSVRRFFERGDPMLDNHPEYYADSMPYGSKNDPTDQWGAWQNPDNKRRTQAPQTYSYQKDHPTDEEVREFRQNYSPAFQDALKNTNLGRRAAEME